MFAPATAPADLPATDPPISWGEAVTTLLATLAAFAVAGLLGGWLWSVLTEPSSYQVTGPLPDPLPERAIVTESFDADVWFMAIGAVLGFGCGFATTALFRTRGLVTLVSVVLGATLATILVRVVGGALGPAALAEQAETAGVGDVLSFPLAVGATGAYLVLPLAAVAGLMLSVSALTSPHSVSAKQASDDPPLE